MANTITIDDNDAQIRYSGEWESLRDSSQQYQSTMHSTWEFDATATFTFTGTGIKVYGTVPAGRGKASTTQWRIDGNSGVTVWKDAGTTAKYGEEFFNSGSLPHGSHTLVIANKGEDNDVDFRLDRIVFETSSDSTPSSGPNSSGPSQTPSTPTPSSPIVSNPTASNSTASGQTASVPSASSQIPSSPTSSSNTTLPPNSTVTLPISIQTVTTSLPDSTSLAIAEKASPTPSIVGGVIGGLAVLILLAFLLICLRRQRRRAGLSGMENVENPRPNTESITPFAVRPASISMGFAETSGSSTSLHGNAYSQSNYTAPQSPEKSSVVSPFVVSPIQHSHPSSSLECTTSASQQYDRPPSYQAPFH